MLGKGGSMAFGPLGNLEGSGGSTPRLGNDGMDGFGNDEGDELLPQHECLQMTKPSRMLKQSN
ncbi:hypothetical protein F383_06117 [Gossypium arboreum]|uniref:Uncharacterized protein n=1 Tax=Gossypium arboreum TaxID=29729 RepID=A0A0B0NDK8_GOSAR|nr:hypothetical protein F383_06117 [Gossypium arboreum]